MNVKKKIDKSFLILIIMFAIISIVSLYCARIYTPVDLGNLALKQSIWYLVGFWIILFVTKCKNDYFYDRAHIFYIIGVVALIYLLFFGTPINGSKCWIVLPGLGTIQPSEFMKFFLMIMLGRMIRKFKNNYPEPTNKEEFLFILKTLVVVMIPSILTFLEPDTGAVIIYLIIYIR